ncbi:MAG: hypothetical protein WCC10_04045 [Tumebacillaceae bacterium]
MNTRLPANQNPMQQQTAQPAIHSGQAQQQPVDPRFLSPKNIAQLQKTIGNRGTMNLLSQMMQRTEEDDHAPSKESRQHAEPFKATDGEQHTFFIRDDEENPKVMVASTEAEVRGLLLDYRTNRNISLGSRKDLEKLNEAIEATTTLESKYRVKIVNRDQKWQESVSELRETIIETLTWVMRDITQTKSGEPMEFDLEWIKPPTFLYPVIYIGPETTNAVRQETLKLYYESYHRDPQDTALSLKGIYDMAGDADFKKWRRQRPGKNYYGTVLPYVLRFTPEGKQQLPNGTQIGIADQYQMSVGENGPYRLVAGESTPGGDKINNPLKKYGFSPSAEKMQGDHVLEIQLGGIDSLDNLWPLDDGLNGASGIWIARQLVTSRQTGQKVPLAALKMLANHEVVNIYVHVSGIASGRAE